MMSLFEMTALFLKCPFLKKMKMDILMGRLFAGMRYYSGFSILSCFSKCPFVSIGWTFEYLFFVLPAQRGRKSAVGAHYCGAPDEYPDGAAVLL